MMIYVRNFVITKEFHIMTKYFGDISVAIITILTLSTNVFKKNPAVLGRISRKVMKMSVTNLISYSSDNQFMKFLENA